MRFLADENIPRLVIQWLRNDGFDVSWALVEFPGDTDVLLLERAELEARVLLTLEGCHADALQRRRPLQKAGVILLRVRPATPERLFPLLETALLGYNDWAGYVSIVSTKGLQIVPADRRI